MSFHRLFIEPEEGFIAHSAGSKKLATDDFARAGLAQSMDDFYRAFARVCHPRKPPFRVEKLSGDPVVTQDPSRQQTRLIASKTRSPITLYVLSP